uniref:Pyrin domain-containing protein n=1 Tax=Seriola dumerili TaxID=41447 RepID=A0A3B4UCI0_SERDU
IAKREKLLKTLEHLKGEEFKKFKWHLQDSDIQEGLPCIPPCRLENTDVLELVDLMMQTYSQQTVEVTKRVYRKINRNDLVHILSEKALNSEWTRSQVLLWETL